MMILNLVFVLYKEDVLHYFNEATKAFIIRELMLFHFDSNRINKKARKQNEALYSLRFPCYEGSVSFAKDPSNALSEKSSCGFHISLIILFSH